MFSIKVNATVQLFNGICCALQGEDGKKRERTDGNQDLLTSIIAVCGLNFFDKILSTFLSSLQLADAKN